MKKEKDRKGILKMDKELKTLLVFKEHYRTVKCLL
jgi:hypothetical protein